MHNAGNARKISGSKFKNSRAEHGDHQAPDSDNILKSFICTPLNRFFVETTNIQLYKLLRHDLRLTDSKSLELMNILNEEYKSGVKEDLAFLENKMESKIDALGKQMQEGFEKIDARFGTIDA